MSGDLTPTLPVLTGWRIRCRLAIESEAYSDERFGLRMSQSATAECLGTRRAEELLSEELHNRARYDVPGLVGGYTCDGLRLALKWLREADGSLVPAKGTK